MSVNQLIEFDTDSPKLFCDEAEISAWVSTQNPNKENCNARVINRIKAKQWDNRSYQFKDRNVREYQKYLSRKIKEK